MSEPEIQWNAKALEKPPGFIALNINPSCRKPTDGMAMIIHHSYLFTAPMKMRLAAEGKLECCLADNDLTPIFVIEPSAEGSVSVTVEKSHKALHGLIDQAKTFEMLHNRALAAALPQESLSMQLRRAGRS